MFLFLQWQLGISPCILLRTWLKRRSVLLMPMYNKLTTWVRTLLQSCLGSLHSQVLLIVFFFGKGKVTWFKQLMKASPKVIHAFTQLSSICELQKEVHQGLEEFMWLLYGERGTTITDVAALQWQIFSRSQLVEHTLSTHVQLIVRTMAEVAKPSLPSHVQYACWTEYAVGLSLLVTKLDPAPVAVVELVRCSCKCSTNRCSCKKMNMLCTDLPKSMGKSLVC